MKNYPVFTLSLFLFLLFSCSSKTTRKEVITGNSSIEKEVTVSEKIETKTTSVSLTEEEPPEILPNEEKEILLVREEVVRINKNIENYTKKKSTVNWETATCELTQYENEKGVIIKTVANCGGHNWELYYLVWSERDRKLLHGKYVETIPNTRAPIVHEFYSIGAMIIGESAYGLILDASGKKVKPSEYRKYAALYEAAFLAF